MRATAPQLAERYACSVRTIWRMRGRGIDVESVSAVADYVLATPCVRLPMVNAVADLVRAANAAEPNAWAAGWKKGLNQSES